MQSSQTGMGDQPSFSGVPGPQSSLQSQGPSQLNVNRTALVSALVPLVQNAGAVASQPAVLPSNQNQSASSNQFNTATFCPSGQETVQEILSRTQEMCQIFRMLMSPNSTCNAANMSNDHIQLHDQISIIQLLFERLRYICDKCDDSGPLKGIKYLQLHKLDSFKKEWDVEAEERKTRETYHNASDEMIEVAVLRNKYKLLRITYYQLQTIMWEIRSMLVRSE